MAVKTGKIGYGSRAKGKRESQQLLRCGNNAVSLFTLASKQPDMNNDIGRILSITNDFTFQPVDTSMIHQHARFDGRLSSSNVRFFHEVICH